ncbi:MAG: (2Fe-2S)-binding protein [Pseudomonadota bacterium]|nr:(2Fe-2S)-binding protein [Pseudomonadota bacterium]
MTLHMDRRLEDEGGVVIEVDGRPVSARNGESVAAALLSAGIDTLRFSPRHASARGVFCLMGSCQECLVLIDGRRRLACQSVVAPGLSIFTTETS